MGPPVVRMQDGRRDDLSLTGRANQPVNAGQGELVRGGDERLHPGISVFRPAQLGICDRAYRESHAAGRKWSLGKPSRRPLGLPAIPPSGREGDSYLSSRPLQVRTQQSCHN